MYNPSDIHVTPMDFGKAAVTVLDLNKRFGDATVLEKINFSVDQDEIVVGEATAAENRQPGV